ncbi:Hypothetical protein PHPALM_37249 [Phytophthora palmivora]|uniref:Uncharacterized protein n=1 Tax=Phytophthora palmivora TaxID=4796 RepID=A0A2P4WXY3_9STRA|nr:Hypothetical protein PHPALM_37249 [Phytophthora palmivora]
MNHKDGYMKLLTVYRRAQLRGEVFTGYPRTKPKKRSNTSNIDVDGRTKHCGFKLINIVFSPPFIGRMVESGALPSTGLEIEPVDGRSKYWRDVATAYASESSVFNRIAGPSGRYEDIDPKLAPPHSSATLCAIWKDMTTKYEDTFSRWKQLGTDSAGFAHFCGDLDVLYLHDQLQIRPLQVNADPKEFKVRKRARMEDVEQKDAVLISMQRQDLHTKAQVVPPHDRSRVPEGRIEQVQDTDPERHLVKAFEGVIYSSQAVRDTMAAIEALKHGRFDSAVIAQAEESMDAIVQVWLGELDKAAHPQAE